jgi:tetratricopeptide (TPR) repeat protein
MFINNGMKKNIIKLILAFLIIIPLSVKGYTVKNRHVADSLMMSQNYKDASIKVQGLLSDDPKNAELNFMLGICYFHTNNDISKAISQFEKSSKLTRRHKLLIEIRDYLAKSYHINKEFDKAIIMYQKEMMLINPSNRRRLEEISTKMEHTNYAKSVCARPVKASFKLLNNNINSEYGDYAPYVTADEHYLFFTSRRKNTCDLKAMDGYYYERIYVSEKVGNDWGEAKELFQTIERGHWAVTSLSFDGKTMLLYKDDYKGNGDIYISYFRDNNWTEPLKMDDCINSNYTERQATISADGKRIYFSSNRPDGKGGFDIYYSNVSEDGDWGEAINAGDAINTEYDEKSPFIHPNNKVLYFSSNNEYSIGGFDIFKSELQNGTWGNSFNVGFPINSTRDDLFYSVTMDGRRAYLSARRPEGQGLNDIYMVTRNDKEANEQFVVSGVIKSSNLANSKISIRARREGVREVKVNPEDGRFMFVIDSGKEYNIDFEAEGKEIMYTKMMFPYKYYNDVNHGVMTLNPIRLNDKGVKYYSTDLSIDSSYMGFEDSSSIPVVGGDKAVLYIINAINKVIEPEDEPVSKVVDKPVVTEDPNVVNDVIIESDTDNVMYVIQLLAVRKQKLVSYFGKYADYVECVQGEDGIYRYLYKQYSTVKLAEKSMRLMRRRGYKDAFVREISNGIPGRILTNEEIPFNDIKKP